MNSSRPNPLPTFAQRFLQSALLSCLFLCGLSQPTHSADPTLRWKTMQTPHFRIYYDQRTYRFALRLARIAEEAHRVLVPYAAHQPKDLTHVIIYNNTDSANGSATVLPRNVVTLFTAPPEARETLNDSDDWLRGLFYHEYLHILHMDTMSGVHPIVNFLIGKTFAPNMLMPRWWLEGWAVFAETQFTGGGRNHSSFFEMYMRTAILNRTQLSISQITNGTIKFPQGDAPYLYGSLFLRFIAKKYGKKKLTEISHKYGETIVPYGMNIVSRRVLKKTYGHLWKEWLAALRKRYRTVAQRVQQHPLTPAKMLTARGEWIGSPRYSSDGKRILIYRTDGRQLSRLEWIDRRTHTSSRLTVVNGDTHFNLHQSGQYGVLSQTEVSRGVNHYKDISTFSLKTGRIRQLTSGFRALEPDISPDGKQIVFVRLRPGQSSLWRLDPKTRKTQLLYKPPPHAILSSPRFSPDGKQLLFSAWYLGGNRDIVLLDLTTLRIHKLTHDRALDIEPTFTPDGKQVIFSSDLDGIYNLYAIELHSGKRRRLTNELFGAFAPTVSPDGKHLAYARFGAKGFNLAEVRLSKQLHYPMPKTRKTWKQVTYNTPTQIYPINAYNPLRTLLPQNWAPLLGSDHLGQTFGLRLNGSDILNFHTYQLSAWFGTDSGEFSYQFSYGYQQLYPSFQLNLGRVTRNSRLALYLDGRETPLPERSTTGSLGMTVPIPFYRMYQSFTIRYQAQYLESLAGPLPLRPADRPPIYPETGLLSGVTLNWYFSNNQSYNYSISDEQGRVIWLQFDFRHPALGSIATSWDLNVSWSEFVALPWARHHVLALRFDAGVGRTSWRVRPLHYLGGIPFQDVLESAVNGNRLGNAYLRGYPAYRFYGNTFMLLQAEYRFPLITIERGISLAPLLIQRMHFAFFADLGHAFDDIFDPNELRLGVGAEFRLELNVGYYVPMTLRAGFAKGLMKYGVDQLYFGLGAPF